MATFTQMKTDGMFQFHPTMNGLDNIVYNLIEYLMSESNAFNQMMQDWYSNEFNSGQGDGTTIKFFGDSIVAAPVPYGAVVPDANGIPTNQMILNLGFLQNPTSTAPNLLKGDSSLDGSTFEGSLERVFAHEMVHLVQKSRDILNSDGSNPKDEQDEADIVASMGADLDDQRAQTVITENLIMSELVGAPGAPADAGISRAVYAFREDLGGDHQLTGGEIVDRAIAGSDQAVQPDPQNLKTYDVTYNFSNGNLRDLIWAGAEEDTIQSGGGDDFLYGGTHDDTIRPGVGNDVLHGGDLVQDDAGQREWDGYDTADYSFENTGPDGFEIRVVFGDSTFDYTNPLFPRTVATGWFTVEKGDKGADGQDHLVSIERIIGTDQNDTVFFGPQYQDNLDQFKNIDIDVGDQVNNSGNGEYGDTLDFSAATSGVVLGSSEDKESAEIYGDYEGSTATGFFAWNIFVQTGGTEGAGLTDPTGLSFTDFEHVIGSDHRDVIGAYHLNPGGEVSEADIAAYETLVTTPTSATLNEPVALAAESNARVSQAQTLVEQNNLDVRIDGGAGNDTIRGTRFGINEIHGGDGHDVLIAGGFASELHGGAGDDWLVGGGLTSTLHGGDGADVFSLKHHTFVEDASTEDYVMWGDSLLVTGGIQQFWMESGWAYWSPFTSLLTISPLPFINTFAVSGFAGLAKIDVLSMATLRYGQTGDGQLIVQLGLGRAGQAVINDYEVDISAGTATGNVFVARQVITENESLQKFVKDVNFILKSGFGVGAIGIDPLILDLDGDGVELTRLEGSGTYFDLDGDGFAERTAWVGADDGLLARDVDGNGTIDDITELFGDAATPGLQDLAGLDSNSDGVIDAGDTDFASLRVWRDLDGDGETDAGELTTLAEEDIAEISLTGSAPAQTTNLGSTVRE